MKNYNVTYTKGHLVDADTGKRIFLKRGGEFTILGDDNQFQEKDDLSLKVEPLDSEEKFSFLLKKYQGHNLEKVAKKGDKFIYRIGISKRTKEDNDREFLFEATLLEDLFMKSKKNLDNEIELKWSLCDCICETTTCLDGDIQLYETVQGLSLSNLFSNMVAFYFPMQRSGACNAFKTFHFAEHPNHKMYEVKNSILSSIDKFRNQINNK